VESWLDLNNFKNYHNEKAKHTGCPPYPGYQAQQQPGMRTRARKGIYSIGIGRHSNLHPVYDYPGYGWSSHGVSFNISMRIQGPQGELAWLVHRDQMYLPPGRYYYITEDYYYTPHLSDTDRF